MQKFNTINVESRFIKSILKNTYLPVLPTIRDGDYIVKNIEYTYKNSIVKCTKSGIFLKNDSIYDNITFVDRADNAFYTPPKTAKSPACGDFAVCSNAFLCGIGIVMAEIEEITSFHKDTFVPGITTTFTSTSDMYDISTHKCLGKYLRWYRDTKNIDLMHLYNCFAGESTTYVHIKNGEVVNGVDETRTSWIVPAHLNKSYTIFMDSNSNVDIHGVFIGDFGRLTFKDIEGDKYTDTLLHDDYTRVSYSSYHHPFLYNAFTDNETAMAMNSSFYILIQTDASHNGDIVVLEGDYTGGSHRVVTNAETFSNVDYKSLKYKVKPSIAMISSYGLIPYSDRLIEYLTQNVISSDEDIPLNVARVKEELGIDRYIPSLRDVWDDKLRFRLYNKHFRYVNDYYFNKAHPTATDIKNKGIEGKVAETIGVYNESNKLVGLKNCHLRQDFNESYDILGFVDKDVENTIFRYRSSD